jgi:hypothetical protein
MIDGMLKPCTAWSTLAPASSAWLVRGDGDPPAPA